MDLSALYKCLGDVQRGRILNLLREGPLCVCHLQEILDEGQVKMSKQLAYLKQLGLVSGERQGAWMIHRLTAPVPPLLELNLAALREDAEANPEFHDDLAARARVLARLQGCAGAGPEAVLAAQGTPERCC